MKNTYFSVPDKDEEMDKIDAAISVFMQTGKEKPCPYTRSIRVAWTLFERMRHDRFCCLNIDSDYCYTYGITLIEEGPRVKAWEKEREEDFLDFEAAKEHKPSLRLDVADVGLPLLIAVAFVWANRIEVPGVVFPWQKKKDDNDG